MFLYFSAAKHLIRRNQAEFSMVWSGLEQYQPRKKEYFWPISESCPTSVFKSIMTSLWINEYKNWNAFYTPYISHSLRIQKIFCCMRCDTRTGLFNFWNFRCRKRSKKWLLQLWLLRTLKNFMLTYFQKLMWFYLLATKDRSLGKVLRKLYSDAKCPRPPFIEIAS